MPRRSGCGAAGGGSARAGATSTGSGLGTGGSSADSLVEGDGFEPSVPLERNHASRDCQLTFGISFRPRGPTLFGERDRGFESVFLQRGVSNEPCGSRRSSARLL